MWEFSGEGKIHEAWETGKEISPSKQIKMENPMPVSECKLFWDDLLSKVLENQFRADFPENSAEQPESAENEQIFSSLDEMIERLGIDIKEIEANKPLNSPILSKWFEKGGKLEIQEKDGKQIWIYINPEGVRVPYIDGYPVFPPETRHPYIDDIDIGEFTGDRNEDKKRYLKILEEEYGLTEIPKGYVLHHDAENGKMQLVKEEYHKEFTHAGGHSKYKEGAEC